MDFLCVSSSILLSATPYWVLTDSEVLRIDPVLYRVLLVPGAGTPPMVPAEMYLLATPGSWRWIILDRGGNTPVDLRFAVGWPEIRT